ncbi:MAG: CvpA family protein [Chloroflexi bacterium]|nr:CvpA family protein [Chloroflexota bacterium]
MDLVGQHLTWMDIAILIVVAGGAFVGLGQGLVRQVFSLAGLFFGTIIASQRYQDLSGLLGFISDPNWARVASFAVILVAVLVAANLVGGVIHRILSYMAFGCLDRIGGGVFGAAESVLMVETVLILVYKYPILGVTGSIEESNVALQLLKLAPAVLALLPPEFDMVKQILH